MENIDANTLESILYGLIGVVLVFLPMIISQRRKHNKARYIGFTVFGAFFIAALVHLYLGIAIWGGALIWSLTKDTKK